MKLSDLQIHAETMVKNNSDIADIRRKLMAENGSDSITKEDLDRLARYLFDEYCNAEILMTHVLRERMQETETPKRKFLRRK